ncbi:hypothetical protein BGX28_002060, partial [Mortierella sp. GBA30]
MGVFRQSAVEEYWSTSDKYPRHQVTSFMSLARFQQLKRFLHVAHPDDEEPHWFSKMEPLSSKLAADFSRYYVPSTDVSIDEMI